MYCFSHPFSKHLYNAHSEPETMLAIWDQRWNVCSLPWKSSWSNNGDREGNTSLSVKCYS